MKAQLIRIGLVCLSILSTQAEPQKDEYPPFLFQEDSLARCKQMDTYFRSRVPEESMRCLVELADDLSKIFERKIQRIYFDTYGHPIDIGVAKILFQDIKQDGFIYRKELIIHNPKWKRQLHTPYFKNLPPAGTIWEKGNLIERKLLQPDSSVLNHLIFISGDSLGSEKLNSYLNKFIVHVQTSPRVEYLLKYIRGVEFNADEQRLTFTIQKWPTSGELIDFDVSDGGFKPDYSCIRGFNY